MIKQVFGFLALAILGALVVTTVQAQSGSSSLFISIDNNPGQVNPGDTFSVTVSTTSMDPYASSGVQTNFPTSQLEVINIAAGSRQSFITDARGAPTINASGEIRTGTFAFANTGGNDSLVTYTFRVKDNAPAGTANLVLKQKSGSDPFGWAFTTTTSTDVFPSTVSDTASITIGAAGGGNQAPVITVGNEFTVAQNQPLFIQANVTDDGLPTPPGAVDLQWGYAFGPSGQNGVTFSAPKAPATNVTFTSAGTHGIQLIANDGLAATQADITVNVTASPNDPPIADAGPDKTADFNTPVVLAGSVSDPDGLPNPPGQVSAQWTVAPGAPGNVSFNDPGPTSATVTTQYSAPGVYTLVLTANDGELQHSDTVQITINEEVVTGDSAVLTITPDLSSYQVGQVIRVDVGFTDLIPFDSCQVVIQFDTDKVQFANQFAGDLGDFIPDSRSVADINASGEVRFGCFSVTGKITQSEGTVAALTFDATTSGNAFFNTQNFDVYPSFGNSIRDGANTYLPEIPNPPVGVVIGGDDGSRVQWDFGGQTSYAVTAGETVTVPVTATVINAQPDGTFSEFSIEGLADGITGVLRNVTP